MKHITFILLILFISCKSELKDKIKPEKGIDSTVYEMWNNFTDSHPEYKKDELPDSWYFHNNKKDANRLAELTVSGKKTATTTGLYKWYEASNADLPKAGTKHIITDYNGKARAIIEIVKVDTIPFHQISKDYAEMDMGTKNEALKKWKKAHWSFLAKIMDEKGEEFSEEMLIVFEKFKIIWTEKD